MKSFCKKMSERLEKTLVKFRVDESKINEKYPSEFKDISNLKEISKALSRANIDIERSLFTPLEVKNGHDPKLKSAGYIISVADGKVGNKVAGLAKVENGNRENIVDAEFVKPGTQFDSLKFKALSWKKQLEDFGAKLYFIPMNVSNADLKAARKEAKAGADLDRDKHKQYASKDWNGETNWYTNRGYDKSGYRLDPYKYKEMLKEIKANDGGWKKDAEAAIDEYESYMDFIKESPRGVSTGRASKFLDSIWSGGLRHMISYVGDLGETIEKLFQKATELDEIKANKDAEKWEVAGAQKDLERVIGQLKDAREQCKKKFEELEKAKAQKNA